MTTVGVVPPAGGGVISGVATITDYDTRERSIWSDWEEVLVAPHKVRWSDVWVNTTRKIWWGGAWIDASRKVWWEGTWVDV